MAEVVDADATDAGLIAEAVPAAIDVSWLEGCPYARGEDEPSVDPHGSRQALPQLLTTVTFELGRHGGGQWEHGRPSGLGPVADDEPSGAASGDGVRLPVPQALQRTADADRACLKVDVLPAQGQRLTSPQTRRHKHEPQGAQACALRCAQETSHVRRRKWLYGRLGWPRGLDQQCDVAGQQFIPNSVGKHGAKDGVQVGDAACGERLASEAGCLLLPVQSLAEHRRREPRQRNVAEVGDQMQPDLIAVAAEGRRRESSRANAGWQDV